MITWTDQALRAEIDYRADRAQAAMGHGDRKERVARRWLGLVRKDEADTQPEKDPEEPSEEYRTAA
ncbi:hypothetical protein [Crossiella cryophila]|uniref:Uncharacterized protein n=1 Tax=Crossiella cryophila TaxID=43355 RepID=A0A7W7FUU5_9PSEU|nr:hypothetical protein [Crossiella cryophila]MBB4677813.1 hypothetical protein [Crossiella cryophila]